MRRRWRPLIVVAFLILALAVLTGIWRGGQGDVIGRVFQGPTGEGASAIAYFENGPTTELSGFVFSEDQCRVFHGQVSTGELKGQLDLRLDGNVGIDAVVAGSLNGARAELRLQSKLKKTAPPESMVLDHLADLVAIKKVRAVKWGRYGCSRTSTIVFPRAHDSMLARPDLKRWMTDWAEGELEQFFRDYWKVWWSSVRLPGASYDWGNRTDLHLTSLSDRTISFMLQRYQYTGGAHGNTDYEGINLYLDAEGQLRRFRLSDIVSSDGLEWMSRWCLARLHEQGAAFVTDGSLETLSVADLQAVVHHRHGLTVTFGPYAVGPYVQGSFHVSVPAQGLRSFLRQGEPAASLDTLWVNPIHPLDQPTSDPEISDAQLGRIAERKD